MLHALTLCGAADVPLVRRQAALAALVTLIEQELGGAEAAARAWQCQADEDTLWLHAGAERDPQAPFGYALALARAASAVRRSFALPADAHFHFRLPG